jgi:hypothetical protein
MSSSIRSCSTAGDRYWAVLDGIFRKTSFLVERRLRSIKNRFRFEERVMDYLSLIEKKIGGEEAEAKIAQKIEGFHGLLTREAAAKLIASEMKLIEGRVFKASEIKEGDQSVDLAGKIEEIGKLMEFPSGAKLRTVVLSDGSGEIPVNFWGEDAVKAGGFHLLDLVELNKSYMKMGKLNIGYKGGYEVKEKAELLSVSRALESKGRFCVIGKVNSIEGMKGGNFLFGITDGENSAPVVLEEMPGRGAQLKEGDSVLLEGVVLSGGKVIVGERARMLLRKNRENIFRGALEGIEFEGAEGFLLVGGERFAVERGTLVKFLNLKGLNEDIDLKMIVDMKMPEIKGRKVWILLEEKEGRKAAVQAELR